MSSTNGPSDTSRGTSRIALLVLRILVASALIVSAVIHLQLASGFQQAAPDGIGGGNVFRIQAAVAVLSGLYVLLRGTSRAFLLAALVALASLAAVLLYRYVQVPTIGPIPSMYEPIWYTTKTITAVAEGLALVLAVVGHRLRHRSV